MQASDSNINRARTLRRKQTEAERRLWGYLRNRRLSGYKFVRQQAINPYIADFVCRDFGLIVEVDGATHSEESEVAYDFRRTQFLQAAGYHVHRVQNADVFTRLPDVLDGILLALNERRRRQSR